MAKVEDALIEFCDGNELSYTTDYSGRCMYGRTCFGIVCDDIPSTLVQVVDVVRDCDGIGNAYDVLGRPRFDSLGLSKILYFPDFNFEE